ncbi:hypothetical protein BD410DRAFT_608745 [Rickenella mellea]|uniref:Uncharacterized protein n=1 Tax=Rickenella mellea TaxID=50990 RepID=A0A4Y7QEW0_9AGAM|nr:hypothetical protein BD410DRAFT_608745 [Rickenella mellea]
MRSQGGPQSNARRKCISCAASQAEISRRGVSRVVVTFRRPNNLVVDEGLYKHFQAEKRKVWFKRIPAKPWDPTHTYIHWTKLEAEIWDADGNVIFKSGQS